MQYGHSIKLESYCANTLRVSLFCSYTHDIEAVSCDEMFVDCTDLLSDTGATASQFASLLRHEIEEEARCTASAGIGLFVMETR